MQPIFRTATSVWQIVGSQSTTYLLANHIRTFVTKQGRDYLRHSANCGSLCFPGDSRKHRSAFTLTKVWQVPQNLTNKVIQQFVRFTSTESATTVGNGPLYSALPQLTVVSILQDGISTI